ncbi:hypothetical protein COY07_04240 [Candidatus Peregrinibacteria bacterium CG_4_10_14_0_2_um_filter_43_11]|nr:MAG: hypothetical protein COY07_04240 [Candidatus Peregrinibacteria bacterium CG_4_10_14_0_2_um_filter_43_11]
MNPEKPNFGQPDMSSEKPASIEFTHGDIQNFIRERLEVELSPERKFELSKELINVASFFDETNIKPYIAGGTGIDLLNGEWNRDHQDLDMAIMGSERAKFFQAATDAGFLITDPDRNNLNLDAITDEKTHNAFLFRSDDQGVTQFEVMFLNETVDGEVKLTHNSRVSRTIYNNAPTVSIEGREVAIQPPEVILFHKLTDGRRKDFRDAKTVWGSLDEEQRGRLTGFLRDANVRFVIGKDEITDIETLFNRAEQEDQTKHGLFFTEREWAKQYVKMDERLKEKALYEYISEKLWETKLEQQD